LFQLLSVKEDVSSKFFAILLGGVTRAISYAQGRQTNFLFERKINLFFFFSVDLDNIVEHLNDLFRIVHATNFKTSVRALQLLFRISEQRSEIDDRFYNALYKKLSEPEWKNSKMLSTFLNLVFKSLLKDSMESRIRVRKFFLVQHKYDSSLFRRRLLNVYYNSVCSMIFHLSAEFCY